MTLPRASSMTVMPTNPKPALGYAPYDPVTGRIHAEKTAGRPEDVVVLHGCIVIPVTVIARAELVDSLCS